MLCGCFFFGKYRAEENCPVRKGDGRIGTGTCLCLLFCRRGKEQSTAVPVSYTHLEISKTDITGDTEIEGAKLTITDENGNIVETWRCV